MMKRIFFVFLSLIYVQLHGMEPDFKNLSKHKLFKIINKMSTAQRNQVFEDHPELVYSFIPEGTARSEIYRKPVTPAAQVKKPLDPKKRAAKLARRAERRATLETEAKREESKSDDEVEYCAEGAGSSAPKKSATAIKNKKKKNREKEKKKAAREKKERKKAIDEKEETRFVPKKPAHARTILTGGSISADGSMSTSSCSFFYNKSNPLTALYILLAGYKPTTFGSPEKTALKKAIALCKQHGLLNQPVVNTKNEYAVLCAARVNCVFALEELANIGGCNFKVCNDNGNIYHNAASMGSRETFDYLYTNRKRLGLGEIHNMYSGQGHKPIHAATICGKIDLLQYLLENKLANVEEKTESPKLPKANHSTSLICAAGFGRWEIMDLLLRNYHANFSATTATGATCLQDAVCTYLEIQKDKVNIKKHQETLKNVEQTIKNIIAVDREKSSASSTYRPLINHRNVGQISCIDLLTHHGEIPMMKFFISCGAEVNPESCPITPLISAIRGNPSQAKCLEVVRCLVEECGTSVNLQDNKNISPLVMAFLRNRQNIVEYLIDRGADTKVAILGSNLLHEAAYNGWTSIVEKLIAQGFEVNQPDDTGKTALYHAANQNRLTTIQVLLSHGATYEDLKTKDDVKSKKIVARIVSVDTDHKTAEAPKSEHIVAEKPKKEEVPAKKEEAKSPAKTAEAKAPAQATEGKGPKMVSATPVSHGDIMSTQYPDLTIARSAKKFILSMSHDEEQQITPILRHLNDKNLRDIRDTEKMKGSPNRFRARIGGYRVVYEIPSVKDANIKIVRVDNRGTVYRRL